MPRTDLPTRVPFVSSRAWLVLLRIVSLALVVCVAIPSGAALTGSYEFEASDVLALLAAGYGALYMGTLAVFRAFPARLEWLFPKSLREQSREMFRDDASARRFMGPLINTMGIALVGTLSHLFFGFAASVVVTLAAIGVAAALHRR